MMHQLLAPSAPSAVSQHPSPSADSLPKELVHRTSSVDVLTTSWTRRDEHHFTVGVRWPLDHTCFEPVRRRYHDPLLVAESIRQATILLAHVEFSVPVGYHFVMWSLAYTCDQEGLALTGEPAAVEVEVSCAGQQGRRRSLSNLTFDYLLRRSGQVIATGTGSLSCTSPAVYRRLRGEGVSSAGAAVPLLPAARPELVGRSSVRNVVLAPTGQADLWRLRVDTTHPTYFHRPNDHVPGILLIDAARQAATAALPTGGGVPASVEISFSRYAELDSPCWIRTGPVQLDAAGRAAVRVTAQQDGEVAFVATVSEGAR